MTLAPEDQILDRRDDQKGPGQIGLKYHYENAT